LLFNGQSFSRPLPVGSEVNLQFGLTTVVLQAIASDVMAGEIGAYTTRSQQIAEEITTLVTAIRKEFHGERVDFLRADVACNGDLIRRPDSDLLIDVHDILLRVTQPGNVPREDGAHGHRFQNTWDSPYCTSVG
jgi:hypothetical protein